MSSTGKRSRGVPEFEALDFPWEVLEHYLGKWGLTRARPLASTPTSEIFKVEHEGKPAVLKILTALGALDEHRAPAVLDFWKEGPVVRISRWEERVQLLEYVDGPSLVEFDDEEADPILICLLKKLHAFGKPPAGLPCLKEYFLSLFKRAEHDPEFRPGAAIATRLLDFPEGAPRLLHGDLHHGNVMRHPERGWLAIDPKGVVGERGFDLANIFFNPAGRPSRARIRRQLDGFGRALALDQRRLLDWVVAYGYLSLSWCLDDGTDPEPRRRVLASAETLRGG